MSLCRATTISRQGWLNSLASGHEVGHDGKTLANAGRGNRIGSAGVWELVHVLSPVDNRLAKPDTLWSDGVCVGYKAASGEMIAGTAVVVVTTSTIEWNTFEHRPNRNVDFVGVPWSTSLTKQRISC